MRLQGHFHLSHNYARSISVAGSCAFVQTGVIGDCNRDGFRHSRVLKGVHCHLESQPQLPPHLERWQEMSQLRLDPDWMPEDFTCLPAVELKRCLERKYFTHPWQSLCMIWQLMICLL